MSCSTPEGPTAAGIAVQLEGSDNSGSGKRAVCAINGETVAFKSAKSDGTVLIHAPEQNCLQVQARVLRAPFFPFDHRAPQSVLEVLVPGGHFGHFLNSDVIRLVRSGNI